MTTLNVDADTMPRKRSFMDAYIEWCIRWIPDSFFFCLYCHYVTNLFYLPDKVEIDDIEFHLSRFNF